MSNFLNTMALHHGHGRCRAFPENCPTAGGMSPEEMISTDAGKILVENLIQRLEYGVFS
jgi:hypothetical protein